MREWGRGGQSFLCEKWEGVGGAPVFYGLHVNSHAEGWLARVWSRRTGGLLWDGHVIVGPS